MNGFMYLFISILWRLIPAFVGQLDTEYYWLSTRYLLLVKLRNPNKNP